MSLPLGTCIHTLAGGHKLDIQSTCLHLPSNDHKSQHPIPSLPQETSCSYRLQSSSFFSCAHRHSPAMMEGKAVIGETDMLQTMQQEALHLAGKALDQFDVTDCTDIAQFIKKEFDRLYGPGWQCIVGTDFGSFVTHCCDCFIYFSIGSLAILLFRGVAAPECDTGRFIAMEAVKS